MRKHLSITSRRRSRWGTAGVGAIILAVACPCTGANGQEVLNAEDLQRIAAPVLNFEPKDQFDAPPNPQSVAGKRFSFTVAPRDSGIESDGCHGFASWEYNAQTQQYTGYAGWNSIAPDSLRRTNGPKINFPVRKSWESAYVYYTAAVCERLRLPSYVGTNAFGAESKVSVVRDKVVAIGFATSQILDYEKIWDRYPYFKAAASGEEARQLAANMKIRTSGSLSDWGGGRTLLCGHIEGSSPTRTFLYDAGEQLCFFNGRVEKIEFLDGRTGTVLATLNAKPLKR